MKDLTNPKWMYGKGLLLLAAGIMSSILLIADHPTLKTAALLALAIWSFARAYYFAFYVIEHYVDPACKFSGLTSFLLYLFRQKKRAK